MGGRTEKQSPWAWVYIVIRILAENDGFDGVERRVSRPVRINSIS